MTEKRLPFAIMRTALLTGVFALGMSGPDGGLLSFGTAPAAAQQQRSGQDAGGKGGSQSGKPSTAGEDSDGKGPKAGQGGKGDSGGKPSWAQEGIPEVELGRLSVARSPDAVLDRALAEVVNTWNPALSSVYSMTSAAFADYVAANWDSITIIDSPLQNLAMLDALFDGTLNLSLLGINPASTLDLAAILVGVASDKTVPITDNTIIALNVIMDLGLTSTQIATLADKAEDVRLAVLEGHG